MSAAEKDATQAVRPRGLQVGPVLLTLPATAAMLVFFVAPIAIFIAYSFLTAQLYDVSRPFTFDAYRAALDSQLNRTLARNSIEIGLLAAVCSVALALPVASWLRRSACLIARSRPPRWNSALSLRRMATKNRAAAA